MRPLREYKRSTTVSKLSSSLEITDLIPSISISRASLAISKVDLGSLNVSDKGFRHLLDDLPNQFLIFSFYHNPAQGLSP